MDNQFEDFILRVKEKGDVEILPKDDKYDYVLFFIHGCSQILINLVPIFLQEPLKSATKTFKIIIPSSKIRQTYENCFGRPFDEAFSFEEVKDSYLTLKAIIEQEVQIVNNDNKKIFLSGFSQGCGMSIYTAFNLEHDVGGVIGLGDYYLLITNYNKERNIPILNVHGLKDDKRLWNEVKKSNDKFQGSDKVILCQDMEHEENEARCFKYFSAREIESIAFAQSQNSDDINSSLIKFYKQPKDIKRDVCPYIFIQLDSPNQSFNSKSLFYFFNASPINTKPWLLIQLLQKVSSSIFNFFKLFIPDINYQI
ncbi:hypothetical protein ABPG72_019146 [Tetrahymena utriculariae]